jgi:hypothetical protein
MGEDEWQAGIVSYHGEKQALYHGVGWHWMALDGTGWQGGHEQGVRILVAELEID